MKIFVLVFLLISTELLAQTDTAVKKTGTLYSVSGVIIDTTGAIIKIAQVQLMINKYPSFTAVNNKGQFVFNGISGPSFSLTVLAPGYQVYHKKIILDKVHPNLNINPIVLKTEIWTTGEPFIIGLPNIVYKVDTIQYPAQSYKALKGAKVAALLNKMEGFEIDAKGNISNQGQEIKKIKFNGKDYAASGNYGGYLKR